MFRSAVVGLGVAVFASFMAKDASAEAPHAVKYYKDYRHWTHVKSMVIFDKKHPLFGAFGGIHHVYANPKALKALKAKKDYPKGSVFAFDLFETTESTGAYTEGKRKFVAFMVRDAKKYKDTAGWSWQAFEAGNPQKPVLKERGRTESMCHVSHGSRC